jgi:hypothetical protein
MVKVLPFLQNISHQDEPKQADDGEENKPKLNIYDFQWTKSDGKPKSAAQIYNQLKRPEIVPFFLLQPL